MASYTSVTAAGIKDLCSALATVGALGDSLAFLITPTMIQHTPTLPPNVTYSQLLQLCQQAESGGVSLLITLAREFHAVVAFLAFICLTILFVGCVGCLMWCRKRTRTPKVAPKKNRTLA